MFCRLIQLFLYNFSGNNHLSYAIFNASDADFEIFAAKTEHLLKLCVSSQQSDKVKGVGELRQFRHSANKEINFANVFYGQ